MTAQAQTIDRGAMLSQATWFCCAAPAGSERVSPHAEWLPATVPGTAASALRAAGKWDFQQPVDLDSNDWWFRTSFSVPDRPGNEPCSLCFDGLAGLAEVRFNGEVVLTTDNMFRSYRVDIGNLLRAENELVIVFRSLTADLKKRRPRPRWKTNLISNQQLRWHRTSLLGRIPGWSPPVPAIGPWRDVRLECQAIQFRELQRTATLEGAEGIVNFKATIHSWEAIEAATLRVGENAVLLLLEGDVLSGTLRIKDPLLWWPHTHGAPQLHDCSVLIKTTSSEQSIPLEPVGFRRIEIAHEPDFAVHVNGRPVYCRGACWTTSDIFTHSGSPESLRHDLILARDAGMNMLRIGGTMHYESDAFYRTCDELGILVWQDFMFANMDYPVDEAAFAENISFEAVQQLDRLAQHPCIAIYCGNSEIEQQAAMLGMPRELWRNDWFGDRLPVLCGAHHPGAAYVPSSPSGGVLPFHARTGVTHYYGVGAYLRSVRELRQADVKFTSECLGFANIPETDVIDEIMGGSMPVTHHPRWKQRVPRDTGAGWDFEDVRDHYLGELFGVDPAKLRSFDMPRYLELSRVTSGEMMARTFSEWRSSHSRNAGGLIWFFKDLWAATGWGIMDHHGMPKAAYYQLKRLWKSQQLTITDEGTDGLHLHLVNETGDSVDGFMEVQLLREPNIVTAKQEIAVKAGPNSKQTLSLDEILGSFHDVNYAYRFGPQKHHVVIATWLNSEREPVSEAIHFTRARDPEAHVLCSDAISIEAEALSGGSFRVLLTADRFVQSIRLSAKGFLPDDNYFHLLPNCSKSVMFSPVGVHSGVFRTYVETLNLVGESSIEVRAVPA